MMYYATAMSLKVASSTQLTRNIYRKIGNLKNARTANNTEIPRKYFFRSNKYLQILRKNNILRPNLEVLEIGTGWIHWEALMLRLETRTSSLLYDVWDNRSFDRLQAFLRQLENEETRNALGLTNPEAHRLVSAAARAASLEEIYGILDFEYIADADGLLAGIPENSRDLVISSDVGEHLNRDDIESIVTRTFEVLRPGGWAYHQIVLTDHLRIYAPSAHPKQYMRFSRPNFDRYINNKVQYINCVQIPEWEDVFTRCGFEISEIQRIGNCDTSSLPLHPDYAGFEKADLDCTVVQFLLRKP